MNPKLMLFKRLSVRPAGMVSGGYVQYNADDQSGVITYNGEVDVHFLFFSKTFPVQGTTVVDPALLQSANVTPGKKFQIGNVAIEVVSVANGQAHCNVQVSGSVSASGVATLDVSQKDISIISLSANGSVFGQDVDLEVA